MDWMNVWLSRTLIVSALVATTLWAADEKPPMLIPQVWADWSTKTFHAPGCKSVTSRMARVSRTAAKMQGLVGAKECAVTDAEAQRQWREEIKKGGESPITRRGGVTIMAGQRPLPDVPPSSSPSPTTPSRSSTQAGERRAAAPSWNEFVAATTYTNAEGVARQKCREEWGSNVRMVNYCFEQQLIAINRLRSNASLNAQAKRVRCAQEWPDNYRMRLYCEGR